MRRWLAMLALMVATTSPASAATTDPALETVVRIGIALSLTGRRATLALHQKRGYDLAARRINEMGGVKVGARAYRLRLEYQDDQSRPDVARSAAAALIDAGVHFLVGPFSSPLVDAVADVAEAQGVPLVQSGGALLSLYRQDRRQLFGVNSTIDKYLTGMIALAAEHTRIRGHEPAEVRVAIAVLDDAAGKEIRQPVLDMVARHGMQVVLDQTLPPGFGIGEVARLVGRVAGLEPDLLLLFGYANGALYLTQQLAEQRVHVPLVGTTHCDGADIGRLGPIADYIVCASQWDAYANYQDRWFGTSVDFLVEYELAYGHTPPYQAAQGAAAVLTLADALERAGTLEREAVRRALVQTDLDTVFGPVAFDGSGKNVIKPMVLLQVQNGRYKVVWPREVAWADVVYPAPRWEDR